MKPFEPFLWVNILFTASVERRKSIVNKCLQAIRIFKEGKTSKEGEEFKKFLRSKKVDLVGIVPHMVYIKVDAEEKEHLDAFWQHPHGTPSLLYHVKGTPFLLLANGNMSYNGSKLKEIPANADIDLLKDIFGITG